MAERYDYVVVGGGSAGCAMARGLSSDPDRRVLLLEAGERPRHLYFKVPVGCTRLWFSDRVSWSLQSEPEPGLNGRRLPIPSGRVLGGNSSINGMVFNRGLPQDFDAWERAGLAGWGYEDLLPYFTRQETNWRGLSRYHGAEGPVRVGRHRWPSPITEDALLAAEAVGFPRTDDFMGAQPTGFGVPDFSIARGRRVSSYDAYLAPNEDRPNLTVLTGARATRIILDHGRATGAEYVVDGVTAHVEADAEVVVCCGALRSPHLLQLSGIGAAAELRRHGIEVQVDLPGVGQDLQEQVGAGFQVHCDLAASFDHELRVDRFAAGALRWLLRGDGPMSAIPLAVTGVGTPAGDPDGPVMRYMIGSAVHDAQVWGPGRPARKDPVLVANFAVAYPRSRGRVALTSADPAASPGVLFNLLTDPQDVADLRGGYRIMREIFEQESLARHTQGIAQPSPAPSTDTEIDAFLRAGAVTTQHPMGTCRMGVDADAVVDGELRVAGVEGLRIADASIFPSQIAGNPNSVVMMAAEKGADLILGRIAPPRAADVAAAVAASDLRKA